MRAESKDRVAEAEVSAARVPESSQAATDLAAIETARRRSVAASGQRWWSDLLASLASGAGFALVMHRTALSIVAGLAVMVAVAIITASAARRRGHLTDDRAVGSRFLIYLVTLLPLVVLLQLVPRDASWWVLVLAGLFAAAMIFAYSRLCAAYENRRLRRGDFGPYDVS